MLQSTSSSIKDNKRRLEIKLRKFSQYTNYGITSVKYKHTTRRINNRIIRCGNDLIIRYLNISKQRLRIFEIKTCYMNTENRARCALRYCDVNHMNVDLLVVNVKKLKLRRDEMQIELETRY